VLIEEEMDLQAQPPC